MSRPTVLSILEYPDPRLNAGAKPVTEFGRELHQLIDGMFAAMTAAGGIGLAAPQVGSALRVFVIDLGLQPGHSAERLEFINPVLTKRSGRIRFEEGCLSVPGVTESVTRHNAVTVRFQDRFGQPHEKRVEGLLAVAVQHENDHLDGVLFIERLSPIKRHFVKRQLQQKVVL